MSDIIVLLKTGWNIDFLNSFVTPLSVNSSKTSPLAIVQCGIMLNSYGSKGNQHT